MENLYIEIENGQVKNHPAVESNLIGVFGQIPEHWELFVRVKKPEPGEYEVVIDEPTYEKVDGVWTDVWAVRPMTDEEKIAADEITKQKATLVWAKHTQPENFTAWVYSEVTKHFEAPIPRPQDGKKYYWHGPSNSWLERPELPTDGKKYMLDYSNGTWVEMTEGTI